MTWPMQTKNIQCSVNSAAEKHCTANRIKLLIGTVRAAINIRPHLQKQSLPSMISTCLEGIYWVTKARIRHWERGQSHKKMQRQELMEWSKATRWYNSKLLPNLPHSHMILRIRRNRVVKVSKRLAHGLQPGTRWATRWSEASIRMLSTQPMTEPLQNKVGYLIRPVRTILNRHHPWHKFNIWNQRSGGERIA